MKLLPCYFCNNKVSCEFDDYWEFEYILHPWQDGPACEIECKGAWSGPESTRQAVIKKWNRFQIHNKITMKEKDNDFNNEKRRQKWEPI